MQGSDSFRLIVRRGPQPNQVFELNKDIITVGRDITNDITINDPEVSRHHLRLTRGAGGFTIEDLGSTNGTFINGQRLSGARPMNVGDMVGLGETVTLAYDLARAPGMAPSPGPEAPQTVAAPRSPDQPSASPYAPPSSPPAQQSYAPQQPAQPSYGQQQQQQPYYSPPPAYGAPQQAAPPGVGYEYDPYAIREEEPRSAMRWVVIGCAALSVFCCCSSIVGLVLIDAANAWYQFPIVRDIAPLFESIARALGFIS